MIQIENLTFKHGKDTNFTLGPISISSEKNLVLLGENGSGKTTLLKCIAKVLKPTSGKIKTESSCISYLNSSLSLPWNYLSGIEYIKLKNKLINDSNSEIDLKITQLNKKYPNKFSYLKNKCYTFSSGQIKICKFICHLVSQNNLLILDEPDSNLDIKNRYLFYDLIKENEFTKEKTIIFSSHNLDYKNKQFTPLTLNKGLQLD